MESLEDRNPSRQWFPTLTYRGLKVTTPKTASDCRLEM